MDTATTPNSPILVVLDTNTVTRDFELSSADWNELVKFQEMGHLRICLPEVVVGETVRQHGANRKQEIKAAIDAFGSSHKTLKDLGMPGLPEIDVHTLRQHRDSMEDPRTVVEGKFRALLEKHAVTVLPVPEVDMADVMERYLRRRRPYKENGGGIADDVIWRSVVHLAEAMSTNSGTQIAFITRNSKDFAGDSKDLHPDLSGDLSGRCDVKLYLGTRLFLEANRSIFRFAASQNGDSQAVSRHENERGVETQTDDVLRCAVSAARGYAERDLVYQGLTNSYDDGYGSGFELEGYDLPFVVENPYIQWLEIDEKTAIWTPYDEMDGTTFGRLEMEAEATIEGYVRKGDIHGIEDEDSIELVDGDLNDHMAVVSVTRNVYVEFHIRSDMGEAEVINLESLVVNQSA